MNNNNTYSAFSGYRRISTGDLGTVLTAVKPFVDGEAERLLIFDHSSGRQVDFDFRGTLDDVLSRAMPDKAAADAPGEAQKSGKGRPKLGVVAGEVTLLPRHWEWLAAQPLKASGTLRRLVDEARAKDAASPKKRIEALETILRSLAGNLPNFEDAVRALYASDNGRFFLCITEWPQDVRKFIGEWLADM
ncbi:MAG: DUF2239 family protein [Treponemataceae bacterium]